MDSTNRILPIKNGHNFRDLGGYSTSDGSTVKWNKLIRSGHLNTLSESDLNLLNGLNIAYDIDFRAPLESAGQPDKIPSNASYHLLSVFETDETDASHSEEDIRKHYSDNPGAGFEHMVTVYHDMVTTDKAKVAYQNFFKLLLSSNQDEALLYHCTAGKDRTGMGSVLLLSALGVDAQTIETDYLLTNSVTADFVNNRILEINQQGLPDAYAENVRALATVSPAYLHEAMNTISTTYGDINHYLSEHISLSKSDIESLKNNFLE